MGHLINITMCYKLMVKIAQLVKANDYLLNLEKVNTVLQFLTMWSRDVTW